MPIYIAVPPLGSEIKQARLNTSFDQIAKRAYHEFFQSIVSKRFEPSNSIFDIFDWKFKKYLTPWIIRLTWIFVLVIAFGLLLYMLLADLVSLTHDDDRGNSKGDFVQVRVLSPKEPEQRVTTSLRIPEYLQEYFNYAYRRATQLLILSFTLLYIRVLLESAIVLFHIAYTLAGIQRTLEETRQSPP
ncbi:MAG: hypothetical protein SFX18_07740 [Pirellulales bacterium]|nr:hypothetical protein [Pirellulales bacterium]